VPLLALHDKQHLAMFSRLIIVPLGEWEKNPRL
jgi:hypothetical protein